MRCARTAVRFKHSWGTLPRCAPSFGRTGLSDLALVARMCTTVPEPVRRTVHSHSPLEVEFRLRLPRPLVAMSNLEVFHIDRVPAAVAVWFDLSCSICASRIQRRLKRRNFVDNEHVLPSPCRHSSSLERFVTHRAWFLRRRWQQRWSVAVVVGRHRDLRVRGAESVKYVIVQCLSCASRHRLERS